MATVKDSVPHIIRTAADQRQRTLYNASIGHIHDVNSKIRLIKLYLTDDAPPLRHLPGQYIDLYVPNISTVGGFTITSPPQTALRRSPSPSPSSSSPSATQHSPSYIELAIQQSPTNPPAAYLHQPHTTILDAPLQFRIGGNFTYPPPDLTQSQFADINNVVFIAGGVGINPIMSMLSAIDTLGPGRLGGLPGRVRMLYSVRRGRREDGGVEEVLFEERLRSVAAKWAPRRGQGVNLRVGFFETGEGAGEVNESENVGHVVGRRIRYEDLMEALGPEEGRATTLVYVCGVPDMTDEFVEVFKKAPGMDDDRVLCEKWW